MRRYDSSADVGTRVEVLPDLWTLRLCVASHLETFRVFAACTAARAVHSALLHGFASPAASSVEAGHLYCRAWHWSNADLDCSQCGLDSWDLARNKDLYAQSAASALSLQIQCLWWKATKKRLCPGISWQVWHLSLKYRSRFEVHFHKQKIANTFTTLSIPVGKFTLFKVQHKWRWYFQETEVNSSRAHITKREISTVQKMMLNSLPKRSFTFQLMSW